VTPSNGSFTATYTEDILALESSARREGSAMEMEFERERKQSKQHEVGICLSR